MMDEAVQHEDATQPAVAEKVPSEPLAESFILYEDEDLFAVFKPSGLVTHPTYKHPDGTLADAVFARQEMRGEGRPWLLHRLDRDTSGLLLFAKTERARRGLVKQFERHAIQKAYLAALTGLPEPRSGTIDAPLLRDPLDRRRTIVGEGGQSAVTRYRTLAEANGRALALAVPFTGRTHQIRAHFVHLGVPLFGDARYLPEDTPDAALASRAMLHAWRLRFVHPRTRETMLLEAALPEDMHVLLRQLGLDPTQALQSVEETFEEASGGTDIP